MKIGAVLFAHDEPARLNRLLGATQNHFDVVVIHVDTSKNEHEFRRAAADHKNVLFAEQRRKTAWGHWNLAEATILAFNQIAEWDKNNEIQHIQVFSNACYPIQSARKYRAHLSSNPEVDFISTAKLPIPSLRNGGIDRTQMHYSFLEFHPLFKYNFFKKLFVNRWTAKHLLLYNRPIIQFPRLLGKNYSKKPLTRLYSILHPWRRPWRNSHSQELWKGSDWYCLTMTTCKSIIQFAKINHPVNVLLKNSLSPPESYFHTIIREILKKPEVKPYLHLVDWSRRSKPHNWTFLDRESFTNQDDAFFARKISANSYDLLDWIDSTLLKEE